MTIEVRQLVIRSSVETRPSLEGDSSRRMAPEQLKGDLLRLCREMVREVLREQQER